MVQGFLAAHALVFRLFEAVFTIRLVGVSSLVGERRRRAITKVTEEMLPLITCLTLLITSREGHVVPPSNGEYILSCIASRRYVSSG